MQIKLYQSILRQNVVDNNGVVIISNNKNVVRLKYPEAKMSQRKIIETQKFRKYKSVGKQKCRNTRMLKKNTKKPQHRKTIKCRTRKLIYRVIEWTLWINSLPKNKKRPVSTRKAIHCRSVDPALEDSTLADSSLATIEHKFNFYNRSTFFFILF